MMVLVINFLIGGVTTLIDNWAHLGGTYLLRLLILIDIFV
jgi:hypothetical protein